MEELNNLEELLRKSSLAQLLMVKEVCGVPGKSGKKRRAVINSILRDLRLNTIRAGIPDTDPQIVCSEEELQELIRQIKEKKETAVDPQDSSSESEEEEEENQPNQLTEGSKETANQELQYGTSPEAELLFSKLGNAEGPWSRLEDDRWKEIMTLYPKSLLPKVHIRTLSSKEKKRLLPISKNVETMVKGIEWKIIDACRVLIYLLEQDELDREAVLHCAELLQHGGAGLQHIRVQLLRDGCGAEMKPERPKPGLMNEQEKEDLEKELAKKEKKRRRENERILLTQTLGRTSAYSANSRSNTSKGGNANRGRGNYEQGRGNYEGRTPFGGQGTEVRRGRGRGQSTSTRGGKPPQP
jgi:hypothetical protein